MTEIIPLNETITTNDTFTYEAGPNKAYNPVTITTNIPPSPLHINQINISNEFGSTWKLLLSTLEPESIYNASGQPAFPLTGPTTVYIEPTSDRISIWMHSEKNPDSSVRYTPKIGGSIVYRFQPVAPSTSQQYEFDFVNSSTPSDVFFNLDTSVPQQSTQSYPRPWFDFTESVVLSTTYFNFDFS